jgi:hypothetical protein
MTETTGARTGRTADGLPREEGDTNGEEEILVWNGRVADPDDRSDRGVSGRYYYRSHMSTLILRGGVEIEDPLELALEFLEKYPSYDTYDPSRPASFAKSDLKRANRGGARISSSETAAILARRVEIERALRDIDPGASLTQATSSVPWIALTQLVDSFADIRGVGFSKATKALHPKRPALIPMLDSVVQAYLAGDDPGPRSSATFGERATALVRGYKRELDGNRAALHEIRRQLAQRGHRLTEVRILDIAIWCEAARSQSPAANP